MVWEKFFLINLLWDQVTEIPDVNRIIVFNKGIWNGLNTKIPQGGHFNPSSINGDNLELKKAQKNEIKKKTSEVINNNIPHFKPIITLLEWNPWNVLSRVISRHHWNIIISVITIAKKLIELFFVWNIFTVLINKIIVLNDPNKGQGL